jgi:hypothetical protein
MVAEVVVILIAAGAALGAEGAGGVEFLVVTTHG